ncbi:hypothetical protein HCY47_07665 [Limosilactobacillus fermentum]|uniref:hypothetical protein n=1 Tax=Limosilactobacillus fermentum TaxID=1613 RepID=UPI001C0BDAF2|nr:hypothetical protein [Limosilactobacillus fermentum]QWS02925.1 hypothetical protein I6U31_04425 [Limosilactobacillus fermentum]
MATESQKKASRAYRERNPDATGYQSLRRGARNFIAPKPGSKAARYAKWAGDQYWQDLEELEKLLKSRKEDKNEI